MRKSGIFTAALALLLHCGCSSDSGGPIWDGGDGADLPTDGAGDAWDGTDAPSDSWPDLPDTTPDFPEMSDTPDECIPPEALIILDRTMSMHRETDGRPKWLVALDAIAVMLAAYPETIWFGLELFPRDAEGCVTLEERISGTTATNPQCEDGEVVIPPGPGNGDAINTRLDETLLCRSTPIDQAAEVAITWFSSNPPDIPERKQVAVLITDGRETCEGTAWCPVTTLLGMGITTYVIGFGDEVNPQDLSAMACAGGTASDPAQCDASDPACVQAAAGADPLFYFAENTDDFQAALDDIAAAIECGGPI